MTALKNSKVETRKNLEFRLGEQINALISASHALNVRTASIFDPTLQPAAFLIVRWLLANGTASATAIAESTAMDRSSVSRLISRLNDLGYVKSKTAEHDRRGKLFSLTDLGVNKATEALKEKESVFYNRISKLRDEELDSYIKMLKIINNG